MNNKTLGIVIIVFGGLVLYSEQGAAWIISAILIGIGSGIFFWKDNKNDVDTWYVQANFDCLRSSQY